MHEWMNDRINERRNEKTKEGTNERSNERSNKWTNDRKNENQRIIDPARDLLSEIRLYQWNYNPITQELRKDQEH